MPNEQLALQPSDVAYLATLLVLIEGGRKSSNTFQFRECGTPLKVLCFLSDRINLQSVKHYLTVMDFSADLKSYLNESDEENDPNTENLFVKEVLRELQSLESIDDLVHYVDSIDSLFEYDATISPNEIMAPIKICIDSSLGIYCRSFRAKWECLSFDSVYQLYESLRTFLMIQDHRVILSQTFDGHKIIVYNDSPYDGDNMGINRFLVQAEKAAENGDVHTAEKLLHRYFDYNGNDPLLSVGSKGSTSGSGMNGLISSKVALEALNNANDPQFNASTRYQQSLLQLAAMWSKNGHYPLAMAAVEESMKTAHQRGDHGSVARALLLLYYVVSGLSMKEAGKDSDSETVPSSGESAIGAEEVLRRCLDRCSTLGMNALAAQATVLLVRLLSNRQCITWNQNSYLSDWLSSSNSEDEVMGQGHGMGQNGNGVADSNNSISKHGSGSSSVKNIWTLLSSTPIGDAKLFCALSKNGNSSSLGLPSTLSQSTPGVSTTNENNQGLSASEFYSIQIQSAIISIEFWTRLNLFSQAELQCRRVLRMMSFHPFRDEVDLSPQVMVVIYCKLCTLILHSAFDMDDIFFEDYFRKDGKHAVDKKVITSRGNDDIKNNNNVNDDNNEMDDVGARTKGSRRKCEACESAMEILQIAENILSTESSRNSSSLRLPCSKIYNVVKATRTYIAICHSLIFISSRSFNLSKSLQLAYRLVDLTSDSELQDSCQNDGRKRIIVYSAENAEAYLLLARLIGMDNKRDCQDLLSKLEQTFLSSGLHQYYYEASALKSFLSFIVIDEEGDSEEELLNNNNNQNTLIQYHRILSLARSNHYPASEALICKYVSMISAFQ